MSIPFVCLVSYTEKERMRLDYTQRVELLALFKHVKLGAYSPDKDTDTGYFDVVGSDRRCIIVHRAHVIFKCGHSLSSL